MPWFDFLRRRKSVAVAEEAGQSAPAMRRIGGRTFAADVPYLLPKDMGETNRLDFQHYMLRYALKGNYAAPLRNPRDILDVGCGTGRWAIEMAQQFPTANVLGVDIAPPPVDAGAPLDIRPENYTFVQGNVLERVPFPDDSFDFTHQRLLVLAIPRDRWPGVVAELLRVTRPGGWVELVEGGDVYGPGAAWDQLRSWGKMLLGGQGIDAGVAREVGPLLKGAGAANVSVRTITLPVGKTGGHIGAMVETNTFSALGGLRAPIVSLGIASGDAFDATIAQAHEEVARGGITLPFFVACGRKP